MISPVLCNVYLTRLDRLWQKHGCGVLVRYADDLLVMRRSRREAQQALKTLREVLERLGLEVKETKTRIVHLACGGEGFDYSRFPP